MGVPPMKHGQDARATLADKGFYETLGWIKTDRVVRIRPCSHTKEKHE